LALIVAGPPGAAAAQQTDPAGDWLPTLLEFEGAPCADASQLKRAITRRSERIQFVTEGESRRVAVSLRAPRGSGAWSAVIQFAQTGQADVVRRLSANSCADLAEAAGFVIAVTLDPPSAARVVSVSEEPSPAASPTGAEASELAQPDAAPVPGSRGQRAAPREGEPADRAETPGPAVDRQLLVSFGGGVHFVSAVAPSVLPGVALFGALESVPRDFSIGAAFAPTARLSGQFASGADFERRAGTAAFVVLTGSLELCPWLFGARRLGLRACGLLSGGGVRVSGSATVAPQTHTRPWGLVGGSLLGHAALSERWLLTSSIGIGVPWVRDTFQFDPEVFHTVGSWAATGTLGLGVVLP
jgi:hypothetical protein